MPDPVLTTRQLNRTTLGRQLLLERSDRAPEDAIRHLVGLQAQVPLNPYLALWSRLERFDPHTVGSAVEERRLVRIVVMRGTIHLLTADDALGLRPLMQPVLDAEIARHPEHAPVLAGFDRAPVMAWARRYLSEPRSTVELRRAIADAFPGAPAAALAYACRCDLPLVQAPPRGVWGRTRQVTGVTTDAFLGRPLDPAPSLDDVLLRYLEAFGPATVADIATWCRLTGLRDVVDRLRPRLRTYRNDRGQELLDGADLALADADLPAPVRFLPEYDNLLLSHADRGRFHEEGTVVREQPRPLRGSVLVDGTVAAMWSIDPDEDGSGGAVVHVEPGRRLPARARDRVEAEARRLVRFWFADGRGVDVRFLPVPA